jgi:bla regulator protein blaR1
MNDRIHRFLPVAGWLVFATSTAPGQEAIPAPSWQTAAGSRMAFEVASVRRSKGAFVSPAYPLDAGNAFQPGRFKADFPLWVYIQFAYKLSLTDDQSTAMLAKLPKWIVTDRFSIEARVEGNPTKDQVRLMMQALLAERFKLAVHFETPVVPVLALTLVKAGKMGPNLRSHADGPSCEDPSAPPAGYTGNGAFPPFCGATAMIMKPNGMRMLGSRDTTMELLGAGISGPARLGRPVIDRTGISGPVDFTIEWTQEPNGPPPPGSDVIPPPPSDSLGPTFLQALRDQLGLKLEATTSAIKTLIIDHVESPSEN